MNIPPTYVVPVFGSIAIDVIGAFSAYFPRFVLSLDENGDALTVVDAVT